MAKFVSIFGGRYEVYWTGNLTEQEKEDQRLYHEQCAQSDKMAIDSRRQDEFKRQLQREQDKDDARWFWENYILGYGD